MLNSNMGAVNNKAVSKNGYYVVDDCTRARIDIETFFGTHVPEHSLQSILDCE